MTAAGSGLGLPDDTDATDCPKCGHDWLWHPGCSAESGLCGCDEDEASALRVEVDRLRTSLEEAEKRIDAVVREHQERYDDAELMLGPECQRQREWAGLRLAVRLLGREPR